ncbi:MAG TPA: hypothetical protein PLZ36_06770 [Armatimonadota bacterium]|nr:hypothetical protein [Armatimonadota bacterium]HOS42929.1 hypothetical protein [Armatimonadota bacterium]
MEQEARQALVPPTPPADAAALKRTRPAAVTAIAVVLILFSVIELVRSMGHLSLLASGGVFYQHEPYQLIMSWFTLVTRLIFGVLGIIFSIALLGMRRWARKSVVALLSARIGLFVVNFITSAIIARVPTSLMVLLWSVWVWVLLHSLMLVVLLLPGIRRALDER